MTKLLDQIQKTNDIRKIPAEDLPELAEEIREFLVNKVSVTGGHLASNLGTVELTMALHLTLDLPKDKIIWDVGHQSYTHKILTGRKDGFENLRQFGGMSGFPKRAESDCDAFDTGHSSTSISAALGMVHARQLRGENNTIVAVIGDGSITGGLAYEAMNNVSKLTSNLIIILNDNNMSISENVGGISTYLNDIRTSSGYIHLRDKVYYSINDNLPGVVRGIRKTKNSLKQLMVPGMYFEQMGITYLGPVDGHNIRAMQRAIERAKHVNKAVLIHVCTKKGKGYAPAENNPSDYHGVGPFDLETGVTKNGKGSYTTAFAGALEEIAEKNPKVVAISAAMAQGTGLDHFSMRFPTRFFDCGIAEEHCVTMAGGMAVSGYVPVVAIYSSFLQRAYDEMITDVCFMNNHVVFALDRSGFVGQDGHTHHGLLDLSYLNSMVNMTLFAPRDYKDLRNCLDYAVNTCTGPVAVRYPRGASPFEAEGPLYEDPADCIKPHLASQRGSDFVIISIGRICEEAEKACALLADEGISGTHINLSMVKPVPAKELIDLIGSSKDVFTLEEGILSGGVGEDIHVQLHRNGWNHNVVSFAVEDPVIKASSPEDQLKTAGLDGASVAGKIKSSLGKV